MSNGHNSMFSPSGQFRLFIPSKDNCLGCSEDLQTIEKQESEWYRTVRAFGFICTNEIILPSPSLIYALVPQLDPHASFGLASVR